MTSVLHDNGLYLYEVLENKFETSKSNYSTLLESPSTLTDISQMRKTPRSQEASNQGASTSRYRAATNFFTPSTSTQERVVNPNIVHDMPHIDIRSQKQQDKDERTLCLDELHHEDMEYQLKITHVEYIDRDTRGISLPNYDLKKHSTFRKRKQFWIAYAGSDIRVVHEDFFSQHYIDYPDKERLFRDTWVHSTIQDNANKKLPLTIQQKQNIIKMATASGYHPKDRIAYIRRDVDDNKFVWKAKTEADIEVIVDDAWVELNLMNLNFQWYNNTIAQQLTNEDINNPEKNRWVQLPVGDFLVIENEDETTITNKKAKIDLNVTEEELYKFNYRQEVFGDVCTLINVLNMLDYMKHNITVAMLVPYMNIHL